MPCPKQLSQPWGLSQGPLASVSLMSIRMAACILWEGDPGDLPGLWALLGNFKSPGQNNQNLPLPSQGYLARKWPLWPEAGNPPPAPRSL